MTSKPFGYPCTQKSDESSKYAKLLFMKHFNHSAWMKINSIIILYSLQDRSANTYKRYNFYSLHDYRPILYSKTIKDFFKIILIWFRNLDSRGVQLEGLKNTFSSSVRFVCNLQQCFKPILSISSYLDLPISLFNENA